MISFTQNSCLPAFQTKYLPGQIVHHLRYKYRGVIVHVDPICNAEDDWYETNLTQPDRNQPWYYVLVDQRTHCTYVAEENLKLETTGTPIQHPFVEAYFDEFDGATYTRNEVSWRSEG
jgi:heat shock protein HspQ